MPEYVTTAIDNESLFDLLVSVKGISPRIADEVIEKLEAYGVDDSLLEDGEGKETE